MSNESKTQTESGPDRLQRSAKEISSTGPVEKDLRKKITAIRQGHLTGGYCETETLHAEEKKLHKIISDQIAELEDKKPNNWQQHTAALRKELAAFSWKPRLVVADEQ